MNQPAQRNVQITWVLVTLRNTENIDGGSKIKKQLRYSLEL